MNRLISTVIFALATVLAPLAFAGGEPQEGEGNLRRFGPFEAMVFDSQILRDVKYENGNVYLQLYPDYKDKELKVKLSNEYFASYREWDHGGYELVSPANQGKPPYAWTDFVNTSANYIEYWMDGNVFLHLRRVN